MELPGESEESFDYTLDRLYAYDLHVDDLCWRYPVLARQRDTLRDLAQDAAAVPAAWRLLDRIVEVN